MGLHVRLWAQLGGFLMDGLAHNSVWCCHNDSGIKPCMLCTNLYTRKSGIVAEDKSDLLVCSEVQCDGIILAADRDVSIVAAPQAADPSCVGPRSSEI